ncbi:MAG: hypothetical protein JXB47_16775 [Anaerolineae bacterium]|nr:hypothetical protein [Anaerolineae bacterium]
MTQPSAVADEFVEIVRNLIAYFVERQRFVALAMLDLHPRALAMGDKTCLGVRLHPYLKADDERRDNGTYAQLGVWKNDWKHWVHGLGCRLTNIHTGEPIEWDAPDLRTFTLDWFWEHLKWRWEHDTEDPYVRESLRWIHDSYQGAGAVEAAIDCLVDRQNLIIKHDYKFLFVTGDRPQQKATLTPNAIIDVFLDLISICEQRKGPLVEAFMNETPVERSQRKGIWRQVWDFKFWPAGWCQLVHRHTGESFEWTVSDPAAIDLGNFKTHLKWRMVHESEDRLVKAFLDWSGLWLREKFGEFGEEYYYTAIAGVFDDLIDKRIILLKRNASRLVIEISHRAK